MERNDGDGTEGGVLYYFGKKQKIDECSIERKRKLFDSVEVFTLHFLFFFTPPGDVAYLSKVNEAMTQRVIGVICSHKGSHRP